MSKIIRTTTLAATLAAAVFAATGAAAAPVSATSDASATARILRPLQLTSTQSLDLGTIVLTGTGAYSATVSIDRDGNFDCDGTNTNVVCSGAPKQAKYNVSGTQGQDLTIAADDVTLNGSNGGTLTLTPDFAATVTLVDADLEFGVGGSITVADTTTDGVYTGDFVVTADYQ